MHSSLLSPFICTTPAVVTINIPPQGMWQECQGSPWSCAEFLFSSQVTLSCEGQPSVVFFSYKFFQFETCNSSLFNSGKSITYTGFLLFS